jgi:ubiquinone/menaquinone biosynthesis C-methylase UbiE
VRGFEQIPWLYDAFCAVTEWTGLDRWRDWLTGGAQGTTLEVGCGTGRNLGRYAETLTVVAVEPDAQALATAKARAPNALFVRASAEALPFRDGAFDTVVSSLVFCSVSRPEAGLSEVGRVLAAGGALRMMEHVRGEGLRGKWQDFTQPAWTLVAGGCRNNRETERTVEAAGFTIDLGERRVSGTLRRFVARRSRP